MTHGKLPLRTWACAQNRLKLSIIFLTVCFVRIWLVRMVDTKVKNQMVHFCQFVRSECVNRIRSHQNRTDAHRRKCWLHHKNRKCARRHTHAKRWMVDRVFWCFCMRCVDSVKWIFSQRVWSFYFSVVMKNEMNGLLAEYHYWLCSKCHVFGT